MKVFISWSGDRSKKIAEVFRTWLPGVLQAVKPYFSPDDIAKGTRWENEITLELAASRIGLLILTPESVESPWLLFEAGALAKAVDKTRVCPLLFDIEATDVKGPLVHLQGAKFSKVEIRRVIHMMNTELDEHGLDDATLNVVFEKWWPDLESAVKKILDQPTTIKAAKRGDRDILEEILSNTREIRKMSHLGRQSQLSAFRDLIKLRERQRDQYKALFGDIVTTFDMLESTIYSVSLEKGTRNRISSLLQTIRYSISIAEGKLPNKIEKDNYSLQELLSLVKEEDEQR